MLPLHFPWPREWKRILLPGFQYLGKIAFLYVTREATQLALRICILNCQVCNMKCTQSMKCTQNNVRNVTFEWLKDQNRHRCSFSNGEKISMLGKMYRYGFQDKCIKMFQNYIVEETESKCKWNWEKPSKRGLHLCSEHVSLEWLKRTIVLTDS